jgi:hypothetical protein
VTDKATNDKTSEALQEITDIIHKYDLWGAVTLTDSERTHWLYCFDPSWSCVVLNSETGEARVRAKQSDFATAEQHRSVIEHTTGAICNTRDYAAMLFSHMQIIVDKMIEAGIEIEHHPYTDVRIKK